MDGSVYLVIENIVDFCVDHRIFSYFELFRICRMNHNHWLEVVVDYSSFFYNFLQDYSYWYRYDLLPVTRSCECTNASCENTNDSCENTND